MDEYLHVDDLTFQVRRSATRTTIGITVDRDASLLLTAPATCATTQLEVVARKKQFQVYTKLAEKALLAWPPLERTYVTGEGFAYLGHSYRLRLIGPEANTEAPQLQLRQGPPRGALACACPLHCVVHRARAAMAGEARLRAPALFTAWYTAHAQPWLERCVALWSEHLRVEPSRVVVSDLGYHWGSCGHNTSAVNFSWRVIQLPARIIEYVVAHELTHLLEPLHDAAFWRIIGRAMPDYSSRKAWLAQNGGRY